MERIIRILSLSPQYLRGRLLIAMIFSLAVIILTDVLLINRMNSTVQKAEYYLDIVHPVKYFATEFGRLVNSSHYEVNNSYNYDKTGLKVLTDSRVALDSLEEYVRQDNNEIVRLKVDELDEYYYFLKRSYEDLGSDLIDEVERQEIRERIGRHVSSVNTLVDDIVLVEAQREFVARQEVDTEQSLLFLMSIVFLGAITVILFTSAVIVIVNLLNRVDMVNGYLQTMKDGDLPGQVEESGDEFGETTEHVRVLAENMRNVSRFASEVGKGHYDTEIDVFHGQGLLGESLQRMRVSLKSVSEDERNRKWLSEGVSRLSDVVRMQYDSIEDLCDQLLFKLIDYTELNQGAIFIYNEENGRLEMRACYAYGRKKFVKSDLEVGEGLVGEAFRDGDSQVVTDIPRDFVDITSGLGKAVPTSVAVVPMQHQKQIMGVIELASLHPITDYQLELFERVAEILGASLLTVKNNAKNKQLLEEAQRYAQRMNAQEEELRQNTEELLATREELERQVSRYSEQISELESMVEHNVNPIIVTDAKGVVATANLAATALFLYERQEIVGRNVSLLMPGLKGLLRDFSTHSEDALASRHAALLKNRRQREVTVSVSKIDLKERTAYTIIIFQGQEAQQSVPSESA